MGAGVAADLIKSGDVAPLLAIFGPTGSGKSELALRLALEFGGEIVNFDSLQIYRRLDIGTAKPDAETRCRVPHHLYDLLEPERVFNAGDFAKAALPVLADITARGALPVLAGGTGFYLRSLLEGLAPAPKRDEALRARLAAREERTPGSLHRILSRLDPVAAGRIHENDRKKMIRCLEICLLSRLPATQMFEKGRIGLAGYRCLKIGLDPDRAQLHARLAERCRQMYATGLPEEVAALLAQGLSPGAKSLESIGYKECLRLLRGEIDRREAEELTLIATRQYAKRQMTWFRREQDVTWLHGFGRETAVLDAGSDALRAFLNEFTISA